MVDLVGLEKEFGPLPLIVKTFSNQNLAGLFFLWFLVGLLWLICGVVVVG